MSIYHRIIGHFGVPLQILKAAEEHAEYSARLTKYAISLMLGQKPKNGYELAEERAACEIMEKQMDIILVDLNGAKQEWKRKKLDKMAKMIDKAERDCKVITDPLDMEALAGQIVSVSVNTQGGHGGGPCSSPAGDCDDNCSACGFNPANIAGDGD